MLVFQAEMELLVRGVTRRIILAGEKRSGTNPLRLAMAMDSEISAPHPPHILQRIGSLAHCYGDLSHDSNWRELIDDVINLIDLDPVPWEYKVPGTATDQRPVTLNASEIEARCKERSLVAIYVAVMDHYAELENSSGWFSKSGQDIHFASEIDRYCEQSFGIAPKWIWLHRDPRDVALSSRKAPIGPKHPFVCAKRWTKLNSLCHDYMLLRGDKMIRLGYEEFVTDPHKKLGEVCDFVGIKFNCKMLEFHTSREARRAAETSPLWGNVDKPLTSDKIGQWENQMTVRDCRIVENVAQPMMDVLGYHRVVHQGEQVRYEVDIEQVWEREDRQLQDEAQELMPEKELRARSRQWKLLNEIALRKNSL
jgi:hypothetical protein